MIPSHGRASRAARLRKNHKRRQWQEVTKALPGRYTRRRDPTNVQEKASLTKRLGSPELFSRLTLTAGRTSLLALPSEGDSVGSAGVLWLVVAYGVFHGGDVLVVEGEWRFAAHSDDVPLEEL